MTDTYDIDSIEENSTEKHGTSGSDTCLTMEQEAFELFQTKYRVGRGSDPDDEEDRLIISQPSILPSNWKDRSPKPGPCYQYSKLELLEYNEIQYMHGPEYAKRWADRRSHARKST